MPSKVLSSNKFFHYLLISIFTLSSFIVLFYFRSIDDNRLTSWQWVFAGFDVAMILLILVFGLIAAYVLSKFSFSKQTSLILLFFSSFVVSALFWKEPEVIVDASRYFTQAKHLEIYGIRYFIKQWGVDINAWTDMPLIPFLYGLIFKFFGELRIYIQIFTALLFSMTVVLTCLLGKELWNEDTGFFAGALLLGIPYLFTQSPLMLVDVPTMFFLTLSIFTFIKAVRRGGIWIVISSIAISLAFFSKYSALLMLSVLVIIFLVYLVQNQQPATHNLIIYRGVITALIAGFLIGTVILFKFEVFYSQIRLLFDYQAPGLRRWGESFLSSFFYQTHPFITIAALYSLFAAFKKRDLRYLIISWLVFLVILFQIRRIRYIMLIFPMLALMASYGLQEIKSKELRRFIVSCIVISSLVIALFAYLPFLQKLSSVNLKNAGVFLDSVDAANIEVLTVSSGDPIVNPAVFVPLLDIFTQKKIHYAYDADLSPPFEKIRESPLRFTWGYKNPEYYAADNKASKGSVTIVVILDKPDRLITEHIKQKIKGYRKIKVFENSTDIFRYSPFVTVYQP